MKFTYEVKAGMYIYRGHRGHSGIAYSLEEINRRLTARYGEGAYTLSLASRLSITFAHSKSVQTDAEANPPDAGHLHHSPTPGTNKPEDSAMHK